VEVYRTTSLDRETLQGFQMQVSEQVLQEKNAFLQQELYQRRRLFRCILVFVVIIIFIIAAAAVAVVVLQSVDNTCTRWLQYREVGKCIEFSHDETMPILAFVIGLQIHNSEGYRC